MHLLALVAVIIVWGIGMIVRPAATIFLTCLVVGFLYVVIYNSSSHPQHQYSEWKDSYGTVHYR